MKLFACIFSLILLFYGVDALLSICGPDICHDGTRVFLSGMNIAWHNYGYDVGNGNYDGASGVVLEQYLADISAAGGNSIRIWIHTDGRDTPSFGSDGSVVAPDRDGTFINDLSQFLDQACEQNIYVFLVLWNGADTMTNELLGLIYDDFKLQSYIDTTLVPMVQALGNHPALGGWEIINEPEGSFIVPETNSNPCLDTNPLIGTGAGWAGNNVPIENMLRFINWQIDAIKQEDSNQLNTIGSWSERAQTDNFEFRNYYKDSCLTAPAESREAGTIDIYQMHSYAFDGSYSTNSPMVTHNSEYGTDDKPNIIGEFSQDGGDGRDITELMEHAFQNGYDGAWTWQANGGGTHSDDLATQVRGCEHLQGQQNGDGLEVDINIGC